MLKIINCEKANKIFDEFLFKIDPAIIDDVDLVIYYKVYDRHGFTKPLLRIKVKTERFSHHNKEEIHKVLSQLFDLEKYALRLKGIKEGCIELIYEISTKLKSHLLSCKIVGSNVHHLTDCGITCLNIDSMKINLEKIVKVNISRICYASKLYASYLLK